MAEDIQKELVQHITRNLLDIQILRLVRAESMWGYKIKKTVQAKFGIKLRHGGLYPLLNMLEEKGLVTSHKEVQDGRIRKVYTITERGEDYVKAYHAILADQIQGKDLQ